MSGCPCLFHFFTDSGKLGSNSLSGVFQIQSENRLLGKYRTVFPDLVDQIVLVNNFAVFLSSDGCVILSFSHGNDAAVKSEYSVFR